MRMIVLDSRPLSMGESDGFKSFASAVGFDIPARDIIKKCVKSMHAATSTALKHKLGVSSPGSVAISTDGWLSTANVEFIGIVAHWVDPDWNLRCNLLSVLPMEGNTTAANIAAKIGSVCEAFGIVPHTIVTDQGANYMAAVRNMEHTSSLSCVAHRLNLVVNDSNQLEKGVEKGM